MGDILDDYLSNREKIRRIDIAIECLQKEGSIPFVVKMSVEKMATEDMPISITLNKKATLENLNAVKTHLMQLGIVTIILFVIKFVFGGKGGSSGGGGGGGSGRGHSAGENLNHVREAILERIRERNESQQTVGDVFARVSKMPAAQIPEKIKHSFIEIAKLSNGNKGMETFELAMAYIMGHKHDLHVIMNEAAINAHYRYLSKLFFDVNPNGAFYHFERLMKAFDAHFTEMLWEYSDNVKKCHEGFAYIYNMRNKPEFYTMDLSTNPFSIAKPPLPFLLLFKGKQASEAVKHEWGYMSANSQYVLQQLQVGNNTSLTETEIQNLLGGSGTVIEGLMERQVKIYRDLNGIALDMKHHSDEYEKLPEMVSDIKRYYAEIKQRISTPRIEDASSEVTSRGRENDNMEFINPLYHTFLEMEKDMTLLGGIFSRGITTIEGLGQNMQAMETRIESIMDHVKKICEWGA